jgi:O-antigen/teichoic acid export membrane protein
MRETIKRLATLSAGYSLVTLIGPLLTALLIPVYTRVLDPGDYRVIDVATAFWSFAAAAGLVGMDIALNAHFFDANNTEAHKRNVATTALGMTALAAAAVATAMFLLAGPLARLLFNDPTRTVTVQVLAVIVLCAPLYNVLVTALRLRMGVRRVNILGLVYLLTLAGANLFFLLGLGMRATGALAATALTFAISVLAGLMLFWRPLLGQIDRGLVRPLLLSGVGILPGVIGQLTLGGIDRLMLTGQVTPEAQGLYGIANKLASMAFVFFGVIWAAWLPMALEMFHKPDARQHYARMFELMVAGMLLVSLVLGLFAPEILRIFTREVYVPAAAFVLGLVAYFGPVSAASASLNVILIGAKQTHLSTIALLIAAGVNVALNLLLIPPLGVWGAVWATVVAGIALCVAQAWLGRTLSVSGFSLRRLAVPILVFAVSVGVALAAPALHTSWPARLMALFALTASILVAGIITPQQLQEGLRALRMRLIRQRVRPEHQP